MNKKQRILVCATLIVFLDALWWFSPRPMIGEDYEVTLVQAGKELRDVTEQVNLEALEQVLRTGTCSRFPKRLSGYRVTGDTVLISGTRSSWHIDFSVTHCVVYDSGKQHGYRIHNGGELWAEVLALMPE